MLGLCVTERRKQHKTAGGAGGGERERVCVRKETYGRCPGGQETDGVGMVGVSGAVCELRPSGVNGCVPVNLGTEMWCIQDERVAFV